GVKKSLGEEKDEKKKAAAEKLWKALAPTLKSGDLDATADLRGPSASGQYTLVAGVKVKDGEAVEQGIKDLIQTDRPEDAQKLVTFNAEKAGPVNIHRIDASEFYDEDAKKMFGKEPIYFAVRSDAAFVAVGEEGLKALKDALVMEPKTARMLQVEVSLK